jgi:hypothetical protein
MIVTKENIDGKGYTMVHHSPIISPSWKENCAYFQMVEGISLVMAEWCDKAKYQYGTLLPPLARFPTCLADIRMLSLYASYGLNAVYEFDGDDPEYNKVEFGTDEFNGLIHDSEEFKKKYGYKDLGIIGCNLDGQFIEVALKD